MLWFGTFVQNTNGMGGKELQLHLHEQHYILARAKDDFMVKAGIGVGTYTKKGSKKRG